MVSEIKHADSQLYRYVSSKQLMASELVIFWAKQEIVALNFTVSTSTTKQPSILTGECFSPPKFLTRTHRKNFQLSRAPPMSTMLRSRLRLIRSKTIRADTVQAYDLADGRLSRKIRADWVWVRSAEERLHNKGQEKIRNEFYKSHVSRNIVRMKYKLSRALPRKGVTRNAKILVRKKGWQTWS